MDVSEIINMNLFNKSHIFEPRKSHIYEPNISLISLINLMFNYAKPRLFHTLLSIVTMTHFQKLEKLKESQYQFTSLVLIQS